VTAPIIVQQPGVGEQIAKGLAPLLQALQAKQQFALQQQQLATQQAVAEANIAASNAETEARRQQTERAAREAKGLADATKEFQTLSDSGQELTQQVLFGSLAKLKSPEAVSAFIGLVPNIGELLSTPARVRGVEAGARTAEAGARTATVEADVAEAAKPAQIDQINLTIESIAAARDFLRSPGSKLPTDPTRAQAIGMQTLGLLDYVEAQNRITAQGRSEDAQERMLARQSAIDVMRQAFRDFNEQADGIASGALDPKEALTLEELLDRNAQAVLGVTGAEVRRTVGAAFRKFQNQTPADVSAFNGVGLLSPVQFQKAQSLFQGRAWRELDPTTQQQIVGAAIGLNEGRQLSDDVPPRIASIIRNLARRIK